MTTIKNTQITPAGGSALPVIVDARFDHFEAFAQAADGWDLAFRQLDRGVAPYSLYQAGNTDFNLSRFFLGSGFQQFGAAAAGMYTFAIVENTANPVSFSGKTFGDSELAVFPCGQEFEAINKGAYLGYTFSFSEQMLAQVALLMETRIEDVHTRLAGNMVHCNPVAFKEFKRCISAITAPQIGTGAMRDEGDVAQALCLQLVKLVQDGDKSEVRPAFQRRSRIFGRALDYIDANLTQSIAIPDLARQAGASIRALEYLFKDQLGQTPRAFIRARKLSAVRNDLLSAAPGQSISELASRYGFWHMGQFARDYRRQFAELPSATRQQRRW